LLIDRLRARPWTSIAAGRQLARLHAGIHRIPAPRDLWTLHEKVTDRVERTAGFLPQGVASRLFAELARLPAGDHLCHGDLQPSHVLLGAEGPIILDWSDAAAGDPVADVALTLFIMRHGAQPPRGRIANAAANVPRRMLVESYLRRYRSLRSVDDEKLARWDTVVALAWLGIASPADQRRLVRLADSLPPK
jgi:aminoglycoside phosphotransferase (APT) family kinase protein